MLRGIIGSKSLIQRSNLPKTSSRIGLLLTKTRSRPNVEHDVTLNPAGTTFNRNTIKMSDNSTSDQVYAFFESPAPELGSGRQWATFYPPITSDSSGQKAIIEFKSVSQSYSLIRQAPGLSTTLEISSKLSRHIASRNPDEFHVLDCRGYLKYLMPLGLYLSLCFEYPNQFKSQTLNSILLDDSRQDLFVS